MKKLFILILLIVPVITFSCKRDMIITGSENAADEHSIFLRVRNASNYDYRNVVLDPENDPASYGDLRRGETSEYKSFESAYTDFRVNAIINNLEFEYLPQNQSEFLKPGRYTIDITVLSFSQRRLLLTINSD